jgi:hypothetical protein
MSLRGPIRYGGSWHVSGATPCQGDVLNAPEGPIYTICSFTNWYEFATIVRDIIDTASSRSSSALAG